MSEDFTLRFYELREGTKLNDKKLNFPFIVSSIFENEDILYQALISLDKKIKISQQ